MKQDWGCSLHCVGDYVRARVQGLRVCPNLSQWRPPSVGVVKISFDAATFADLEAIGVGVIVQEAHGKVIAAMSERLPHWVDADCDEALAAASAIAFEVELGLSHIHLEGDTLSIIKAFRCEDQVLSCFGHILQGAVCTSRCFTSFCCSHVLRGGNKAAYGLACLAGRVLSK
ncbi:hypothetical protein LOK49_LG08G00957 [Camellia lanceoleosa]|uniref:Uncharacterized protein n=1 Tax=Camellia lanceoleosa TaxID=1840588 RepID=A0ACC0GU78_9ERIC|nr:hypothetical protein LOK49_LG08G00957 [Camellia lanceoleosa]